ncbi:unnamed protein product [Cuscuta epithymum]|uniref:Retrotransposon Copia-like N-terminal domain-containing protein n=1 Tax=Cuscuta epithymum TaxID=186058 RepID=A0AAV0DIM2_9ASTE|nr:unnamed protein product [Cuscuta epithymum]
MVDGNQLADHLVNPANPLFLHPGENPALILVSPPLAENNFQQWKHDMLIALETKNKDQFVLGTIPCPKPEDPLYEAWRRCDKIVMSWITRSMTSNVRQSVMWIDTASEIWKDLCDRFSHGNKFRIADLQEQIQNCKQGDLTVSQYFTQLQILWKELSIYRVVLACSCKSKCNCGILEKIQKERDDDCVIKFLRGLNDSYAQVRSQVMLIDPMPTLSRTFSLIQQQEREFGVNVSAIPQEVSANALYQGNNDSITKFSNNRGGNSNNRGGFSSTRGGRSGRGNGNRNNKFCTKCNRTNHTVDTCFLIHGYPPGYRNNGNEGSRNISGYHQFLHKQCRSIPSGRLEQLKNNLACFI